MGLVIADRKVCAFKDGQGPTRAFMMKRQIVNIYFPPVKTLHITHTSGTLRLPD